VQLDDGRLIRFESAALKVREAARCIVVRRGFIKPRNYLQISTEIFILTGGSTSLNALSDA